MMSIYDVDPYTGKPADKPGDDTGILAAVACGLIKYVSCNKDGDEADAYEDNSGDQNEDGANNYEQVLQ